ncbi:VOC family protein [Aestuariibacter sp. A3R04]|uniref:VOC family protein n=1 Tax=Aestuariibacter sp. A3R04 TaxID=2841571 RepID=UPI001C08E30B|nr:VOC family protein [Aestuariibacter sp. A3R04]MBU3020470.1 VOC family protein [Aestuariibacter sp. A3R04]
MIGYITCGTNDIIRSGEFYDQIFELLGAKRIHTDESSIAWARDGGEIIFTTILPVNGRQATAGNGTMIAFRANSTEHVQALYRRSLDIGASDEGAPGIRSGGFYCAYIRDLDNNKLNFHFNPNS